jgi:hypothetical protein
MRTLQTLPFGRWPFPFHVLIAAAVTLITCVTATWVTHRTTGAVSQGLRQLSDAQSELATARLERTQRPVAPPDFSQRLPAASRSDEVIREAGRLGESNGVRITSLAIHKQAATAKELGQVRYSVVLNGGYSQIKAWLSGMQGRYATLAVGSLSIRPLAPDAAQQEVQLTLVLFTKD